MWGHSVISDMPEGVSFFISGYNTNEFYRMWVSWIRFTHPNPSPWIHAESLSPLLIICYCWSVVYYMLLYHHLLLELLLKRRSRARKCHWFYTTKRCVLIARGSSLMVWASSPMLDSTPSLISGSFPTATPRSKPTIPSLASMAQLNAYSTLWKHVQ